MAIVIIDIVSAILCRALLVAYLAINPVLIDTLVFVDFPALRVAVFEFVIANSCTTIYAMRDNFFHANLPWQNLVTIRLSTYFAFVRI